MAWRLTSGGFNLPEPRWVLLAAAGDRNDTAIPAPRNNASPSPSSPKSLYARLSPPPPSMTFRLQFGDVERQEDREKERGGGRGDAEMD